MAPELPVRLSELYHEALAQPPGRRREFVRHACGEDDRLRHDLESLLGYAPAADRFLETPAARVVAGSTPEQVSREGRRFGPYAVVARLGAGGMGEVYRAHDARLQRDVAIKILPRHLTLDPERRARFAREARLLATLNHPNVGAIYGVEESAGETALVLELIEGPTLADRLGRGPLPVPDALAIGRQITEGLDAAHAKGIVHRDLKPANIVLQGTDPRGRLTSETRVKILDFGLARPMATEASTLTASPLEAFDSTADGRILGTPAYMSPEQARGLAVDKRTDVWAFGCVLFEMLSGRRAFEGHTMTDTLARVLEHEPDWALVARTPPAVRRLLRRCLQKDPVRRMRDIGDARAEIEDALAEPAAIAAPVGRRGLPPVVLAATAMLGLAAVAAAWLLRGTAATPVNPLENAVFTRFTNFEGTERSAAISPDGRFVAFRSDREGPLDVWLGQVGTGRFQNVTRGIDDEFATEHPSAGFSGDGSEIWLAGGPDRRLRLMPMIGGTARPFLTDRAVTVSWSPDGERVAYHLQDDGDSLYVADRTGTNARLLFRRNRNEHNHFPVWSVDGRWIYFTSGTPVTKEMDVWRIPAAGGTAERLTNQNSDVASPTPIDSRTLLFVAHDQDGAGPWLWELDVDRKRTRRISFGVEKYTSLAGTPDGRRLVATVANPGAALWTVPVMTTGVAEEADVRPFPLSTAVASAPQVASGSLFYLSSLGAGDGVWRFDDGPSTEIWKGGDGAVLASPAPSRDGRRVAIVIRRQGKLRLHVLAADGGEMRAVAESVDVRGGASWSPDGKWIVVGGIEGGRDGLFKIPADGGEPVRLLTGTAFNPVWSPHGGLIAYMGANVSANAPLLAVREDGAPVELPRILLRRDGERIRFMPDGQSLLYMEGTLRAQDFWLLDLTSMKSRQLTRLTGRDTMRTFDVMPDGKHIVFDRLRDNSDIVLIDLPNAVPR
jgi:Tol biopolymer transport system component/tRNA A-37 threonylcarbamoyl transferase component Bud32